VNEEIFILCSTSIFSNLREVGHLLRRVENLCLEYQYKCVEVSEELIQVSLNGEVLELNVTLFKEGGDKGAKLILGFYNYCKNRVIFDDEQRRLSAIGNFANIKMIIGIDFQSIKNSQGVESLLKHITGTDDLIFDGAYVIDNSLNILAKPK